jgi:hypothetical protein
VGTDAAGRQPSRLVSLDHERAELIAAFPGWRIWYVPLAAGDQWHAHRLPLLQADSPANLRGDMDRADRGYSREPCPQPQPSPAQFNLREPWDRELRDLMSSFPGWRIWYVPRAFGGATWCAERHPLLQASGPRELAGQMLEADERYSAGPYESDETGWLGGVHRPQPEAAAGRDRTGRPAGYLHS